MKVPSKVTRRTLLAGGVALLGATLVPGLAAAQEEFPSKTIEVISHASPGGGTDTTARMMMIRTRGNLDQDMVVVYKRGGGARNAQEYFQNQPADGHTVLALTQTHLYTIARGDSSIGIDDLVGVARAMDDPTFITVPTDSEHETLEDLIAASKEAPLNWGVAQIGSTEHIGLARLAEAAGMQYKVVAFGSGGEMVAALMSGAIDATLPNVSEAKSQIEDGTFRALAVMDDERLDDFPDVPSIFEKGFPIKVTTTRGYAVRKGTPPERVRILEEAMLDAMRHETFSNYLSSAGLDPEDSIAGAEEWDRQLKEEYTQAKDALTKLGLVKTN